MKSLLNRLKIFKILEHLKHIDREGFIDDVMKIYAAKRAIQVIAEFSIDLSNYILLKNGKDILKHIGRIGELKLCRHNVIKFMEGLIELRNIIVHMCADVKIEVIYRNLNRIIKYSRQYVNSCSNIC